MLSRIEDLIVSFGSGLATLHLIDINGNHEFVHADNGPLCRALIDAYDAAGAGHTIDVDKIKGQWINWEYDEMGLCMAGFNPAEPPTMAVPRPEIRVVVSDTDVQYVVEVYINGKLVPDPSDANITVEIRGYNFDEEVLNEMDASEPGLVRTDEDGFRYVPMN